MEVIATKKGFYNGIKNEGVKFTLVHNLPSSPKPNKEQKAKNIESQFSETWMKKVEAKQIQPKAQAKKVLKS